MKINIVLFSLLLSFPAFVFGGFYDQLSPDDHVYNTALQQKVASFLRRAEEDFKDLDDSEKSGGTPFSVFSSQANHRKEIKDKERPHEKKDSSKIIVERVCLNKIKPYAHHEAISRILSSQGLPFPTCATVFKRVKVK